MVFPSPDPSAVDPLKMPQIRHTYLHYLLDPMAEKHFTSDQAAGAAAAVGEARAAGREFQDAIFRCW